MVGMCCALVVCCLSCVRVLCILVRRSCVRRRSVVRIFDNNKKMLIIIVILLIITNDGWHLLFLNFFWWGAAGGTNFSSHQFIHKNAGFKDLWKVSAGKVSYGNFYSQRRLRHLIKNYKFVPKYQYEKTIYNVL